MGLSEMQNVPDWEQQIRFANNAGHGQYIGAQHWLGEGNMNQLGLADVSDVSGIGADGKITEGINAAADVFTKVYGTIQANKANKRRGAPQQRNPASPPPMQIQSGGGGGELIQGVPNWVLYAGGALMVVVLMFALMKKNKPAAEHKESA